MKFSLTKFEQFALTRHLVGLPSPNPEHGRRRLRAWDELGVADLADKLAGFGGEIVISEWSDRTTTTEVELSDDIVAYLIAGLRQEAAGAWADIVTRVLMRLEKAK